MYPFDPPSHWYSLCNVLLLEECLFKSIMIKCGLIRRKVVCGEMTTIILNDQWISFKSEYELGNIEINQRLIYLLKISCTGGMYHL